MSQWVADVLEQGLRENAERVRALKLVSLKELLTPEILEQEIVKGIVALVETIALRSIADIMVQGTPFVWKNLERVFHALAVGSAEVQSLAPYLLASLYDAFYDWLPLGAQIFLKGDAAADFVFPRLGIQLPSIIGPIALQRLVDRSLELTYSGKRIVVDLDDPSPYGMRSLAIPGYPRKQLISVRTAALFELDYIAKIAPPDRPVENLAVMIGLALALIETADPALASRMRPFLHWFVPLTSPNFQTHNSFSVSYLPGVLFLSDAYHDSRLAEAIVHEFHHNELYIVQETVDLFPPSDSNMYYSPWRPDCRPINGLLHALHVFTGVADFLARAEKLDSYRPCCDRSEIVRRLQLGVLQVNSERLSPRGQELFASIEQEVLKQEVEFGPLVTAQLSPKLRQHLADWKAAHPHFTDTIRLPEYAS